MAANLKIDAPIMFTFSPREIVELVEQDLKILTKER